MLFLNKQTNNVINLLPEINNLNKVKPPEIDYESIDEMASFVSAKIGKDKKYTLIIIKYIFEEMMYMMLDGWTISFWPTFKLKYHISKDNIKYKTYTRWRFIKEWYNKSIDLQKEE